MLQLGRLGRVEDANANEGDRARLFSILAARRL